MMFGQKSTSRSLNVLSLLLVVLQIAAAFHAPVSAFQSRTSLRTEHTCSTRIYAARGGAPGVDWRKQVNSEFFEASDKDDLRYSSNSAEALLAIDAAFRWIPAIIPILAYVMYDPTAACFASILDSLANNNFVVVDGGQYKAKIIAPAINGVVVPAISILFANLIGTTITTLRQRQLDIRTAINMEAGQLRILQSLLDVIPNGEEQNICWTYLAQYTSRLVAESQPALQIQRLNGSLDTELNGVIRSLNRLAVLSQAKDAKNAPSPLVLDKAYQSCTKLYEERAKRITALRSAFPLLHFLIVATLAVSICIAFLLESNQDLLMFLNAIQLRILWTMLVGTFSALAIVCYDLGNPFRGSYQISKSVDQLYTIRLALLASLDEMETNREDVQDSLKDEQLIVTKKSALKPFETEVVNGKS